MPYAGNLREIAAICRHLDGIPLAIEFAAARAAALGLQQVTVGLRDRFALLSAGRRTALPRQQTLRATLDWSYELLPEPEKRLLRCLAVFPAGFTLAAAVAVMDDAESDASAVVDGIANLVAKSLVSLDRPATADRPDTTDKPETITRWYLLETTRAYGSKSSRKAVKPGRFRGGTRTSVWRCSLRSRPRDSFRRRSMISARIGAKSTTSARR